MPWSSLPPEVLEQILSNIRFPHRIELSLVSRRWNDVIFGLGPHDYCLTVRSFGNSCVSHLPAVLRSTTRRYRNLEVEWEESENFEGDEEKIFFEHLDESLAILTERETVRCLWLTAPLDGRIVRFFSRHGTLLDSLEEFWVTISNRIRKPPIEWTPVEVTLGKLKILKWDEYEDYTEHTFQNYLFSINLPNATSVELSMDHESISKDRSLILLRNADNVEDLIVTNLVEYCSKQYFAIPRPKLERLCIESAMNQITDHQLTTIASYLPNLKSLQLNMIWRDFRPSLLLAFNLPSLKELSLALHGISLSELCKNLQNLRQLQILHLSCHGFCTVDESVQIVLPQLVEFRCKHYSAFAATDNRIGVRCPGIVKFQIEHDSSVLRNYANVFQLLGVEIR